MSKKKYISTGANPLSIDIMDGEVLYTFDFRGGLRHPRFIPPCFITEDPKKQRLLEKHPLYNKEFMLDVELSLEENKDVEPSVTTEVPKMDYETKLKEVSFANVQDAKIWLNREHGVSFTKTKNKAKIIDVAKKLKLNIRFETDKILK